MNTIIDVLFATYTTSLSALIYTTKIVCNIDHTEKPLDYWNYIVLSHTLIHEATWFPVKALSAICHKSFDINAVARLAFDHNYNKLPLHKMINNIKMPQFNEFENVINHFMPMCSVGYILEIESFIQQFHQHFPQFGRFMYKIIYSNNLIDIGAELALSPDNFAEEFIRELIHPSNAPLRYMNPHDYASHKKNIYDQYINILVKRQYKPGQTAITIGEIISTCHKLKDNIANLMSLSGRTFQYSLNSIYTSVTDCVIDDISTPAYKIELIMENYDKLSKEILEYTKKWVTKIRSIETTNKSLDCIKHELFEIIIQLYYNYEDDYFNKLYKHVKTAHTAHNLVSNVTEAINKYTVRKYSKMYELIIIIKEQIIICLEYYCDAIPFKKHTRIKNTVKLLEQCHKISLQLPIYAETGINQLAQCLKSEESPLPKISQSNPVLQCIRKSVWFNIYCHIFYLINKNSTEQIVEIFMLSYLYEFIMKEINRSKVYKQKTTTCPNEKKAYSVN